MALSWGLGRLAIIFDEERTTAHTTAEAERSALQEYAGRAMAERLRARLREASKEIALAAADPLIPSDDLLFVRSGRQLLPATPEPSGADDPTEGELVERRRRIDRFLRALADADAAAQETTMRHLLVHRALFVLSPSHEVRSTLELLEAFTKQGQPHATLMRRLLRDGFDGAGSGRIEGVQRRLLRARPGMDPTEVDRLGDRIAALSKAHRVPRRDFERALAQPLAAPVQVGESPVAATLLPKGDWLIGPGQTGEVLGVRQPLAELAAVIEAEMLGRGLLQPGERLSVDRPAGRVTLDQLAIDLDSGRFAAARQTADEALSAKRLWLAICWLLGGVIVALAVLAQARKVRFLRLREDFVSMVSHELRTPLASIRVMAETLGRKLKGRPEARDYPERIVRAADRLHGLVENVLTFERAERGRLLPVQAAPERRSGGSWARFIWTGPPGR